MRSTLLWLVLVVSFRATGAFGQARQDSSSHRARFVRVAPDVQLEVLDWGGGGRTVVLLAGLGGTAHDFDALAPKLAADHRVIAVTRRGFGRSSAPPFGYGADSLADDILAVVDSLGLRRPILAGHSIAGQELSSVGNRYPEKVSGLIYLDAGFSYAFYDESHRSPTIEVNEIIRHLNALRSGSGASQQDRRTAMLTLADTSLPWLSNRLRVRLQDPAVGSGPAPPPMARIPYAMESGERKFTRIGGPVLAIYAWPRPRDPAMHDQLADMDSATAFQIRAFQRGVPQARVVRLPYADHYVFRSNEADVLREMRAFIRGLPDPPK